MGKTLIFILFSLALWTYALADVGDEAGNPFAQEPKELEDTHRVNRHVTHDPNGTGNDGETKEFARPFGHHKRHRRTSTTEMPSSSTKSPTSTTGPPISTTTVPSTTTAPPTSMSPIPSTAKPTERAQNQTPSDEHADKELIELTKNQATEKEKIEAVIKAMNDLVDFSKNNLKAGTLNPVLMYQLSRAIKLSQKLCPKPRGVYKSCSYLCRMKVPAENAKLCRYICQRSAMDGGVVADASLKLGKPSQVEWKYIPHL